MTPIGRRHRCSNYILYATRFASSQPQVYEWCVDAWVVCWWRLGGGGAQLFYSPHLKSVMLNNAAVPTAGSFIQALATFRPRANLPAFSECLIKAKYGRAARKANTQSCSGWNVRVRTNSTTQSRALSTSHRLAQLLLCYQN